MTVEQIIQTICKPLADSPSLSNYVQMAEESLDNCFFGKQIDYAVAYKACHLFTVLEPDSIRDLGNGSISSYSEGGMSVSFAQNDLRNELDSTKYGRMLLSLMKTMPLMNINTNPLVYGGLI